MRLLNLLYRLLIVVAEFIIIFDVVVYAVEVVEAYQSA
jgi:hypothetical protein